MPATPTQLVQRLRPGPRLHRQLQHQVPAQRRGAAHAASRCCSPASINTKGSCSWCAGDDASPCLRCVWPEATRDGLVGNCAEAGVLGPGARRVRQPAGARSAEAAAGPAGPGDQRDADLRSRHAEHAAAARAARRRIAWRISAPAAPLPRRSRRTEALEVAVRLAGGRRGRGLHARSTCATRASAQPSPCRSPACTCRCPNY